MRRVRSLPLFFLSGMMLVSPALAENFLGASLLNTDSEFETAVDTFDPDDSGWKIFTGNALGRVIGYEISYRDLGEFKETTSAGTFEAEIKVFDGSLRARFPLTRKLAIFGRGGYARVSVEGALGTSLNLNGIDEDDWEFFYGAGLEFDLIRSFGLRAEWEEFDVDDDLNTISIGGFFRF